MIFETVNDFKRFVLRRLVNEPNSFRNTYNLVNLNASFTDIDLSEYKNTKDYIMGVIFEDWGYKSFGYRDNINFIQLDKFCSISTHIEPIKWTDFDNVLEEIFIVINEVVTTCNIKDYVISIDFDCFYYTENDKNILKEELYLLEREIENV